MRHVNFDSRVIHVREAWSGTTLGLPKADHVRDVPMTRELQDFLKPATQDKLPGAFVIVNSRGNVPTRQAVYTALMTLQTRHGFQHRSFHALRHWFCSRLLNGGGNVEAVRRLMGHSKLTTTARYAHATSQDERAAIASLSGNVLPTVNKRDR